MKTVKDGIVTLTMTEQDCSRMLLLFGMGCGLASKDQIITIRESTDLLIRMLDREPEQPEQPTTYRQPYSRHAAPAERFDEDRGPVPPTARPEEPAP